MSNERLNGMASSSTGRLLLKGEFYAEMMCVRREKRDPNTTGISSCSGGGTPSKFDVFPLDTICREDEDGRRQPLVTAARRQPLLYRVVSLGCSYFRLPQVTKMGRNIISTFRTILSFILK